MGSAHVFVSYTSADRPFADELVRTFESAGLRIWYAPRDVRPGIDYSEQIQKAIETAASFVVIVTEASNRSNFVRAETEMAFSRRRPIFPVRTSAIAPASGLALFLQLRHWTDAFGPGRQGAVTRLADELVASQRQSGGSARSGPTLFRPRFRRGAADSSSEPTGRRRVPIVLGAAGGGALVLALALAVSTEPPADPQAGQAASGESLGNMADGKASPQVGEPDYDPLRESWMRYIIETTPPPPPPPEEIVDNGMDTDMSMDANMASDPTKEVNGM